MIELLLSQPSGQTAFWVWLSIGGGLLVLEMLIGTQWLLWPAASAGIVAVVALTGAPANLLVQIVIFCVLTTAMLLLSKKFLKSGTEDAPDINDPHLRLTGQEATVIEAFDDRDGQYSEGRVILNGVEWPALCERPETVIEASEKVRILNISEGRLIVGRA